jgi:general secretion pathway protein D
VIRQAQIDFNPKREPTIDQLVIDYLGAVPPAPPQQPGDVLIVPAAARPAPAELAPVPVPPSGQ